MAAKNITKAFTRVPVGAMGDVFSSRQATENANQVWSRLVQSIEWPDKLTVWNGPARIETDEQKEQKEQKEYLLKEQGAFWSEKKGSSIRYDSPLQFRFYQILEEASLVFWYSRRDASGRSMGTAGDGSVLVTLGDKRILLAEIMPVRKMAVHSRSTRYSALLKHCHSAGLGYMVTDGIYTLQQLQKNQVLPALEEKLLLHLQAHKGRLEEKTCRQFLLEEFASELDLMSIVFKNGLEIENFPFCISQGKPARRPRVAAKYMRL